MNDLRPAARLPLLVLGMLALLASVLRGRREIPEAR